MRQAACHSSSEEPFTAKPRKRQTACPSVNAHTGTVRAPNPSQHQNSMNQNKEQRDNPHNTRLQLPATHPPHITPPRQQQPPSQREPHRHFFLVHCLVKGDSLFLGRKEGRKEGDLACRLSSPRSRSRSLAARTEPGSVLHLRCPIDQSIRSSL